MNCGAEPGLGHPIFIGRSGFLSRTEAKKRIHRFALEVPLRLNESPPAAAA
jgi:hypothetical protein